jgi:uncharacterized protein (TIGR02246 family)
MLVICEFGSIVTAEWDGLSRYWMTVAYDQARLSRTAEASAVADLYERLISAWNATDAKAFAATLADEGVVIGFDGSELVGRIAVEREMTRIFADHRPARYVANVHSIEELADTITLLRAVVGMIPPGESELHPDRNAHQTVLARRRDEGWQIVLFQNTPAQFHGRPKLSERLMEELTHVARESGL